MNNSHHLSVGGVLVSVASGLYAFFVHAEPVVTTAASLVGILSGLYAIIYYRKKIQGLEKS